VSAPRGSSLARPLQILIASAAIASLVADAWWYARLRDGTFILHVPDPGDRFAQPYWTGTTVSSLLVLPGFVALATVIVWLLWQHRATSNLWARGYANLKIRPGWAVGWWFIPFASLVMPCIAMVELDRRSTPDGSERRASPLIGVWWAAWLASSLVPVIGIVSAISPTLADLARRIDQTANIMDLSPQAHVVAPWFLVGGILQVTVGALAIAVVRRIEEGQRTMLSSPAGWMVPVPARPDATH
jgi:hypothetical protein